MHALKYECPGGFWRWVLGDPLPAHCQPTASFLKAVPSTAYGAGLHPTSCPTPPRTHLFHLWPSQEVSQSHCEPHKEDTFPGNMYGPATTSYSHCSSRLPGANSQPVSDARPPQENGGWPTARRGVIPFLHRVSGMMCAFRLLSFDKEILARMHFCFLFKYIIFHLQTQLGCFLSPFFSPSAFWQLSVVYLCLP